MALKGMTFDNDNVSSMDDSRLYKKLGAVTGIYKGTQNECSATVSGLVATVNTGYINILGRQVKIDSLTDVIVPSNPGFLGYIIAKIDLNQTGNSRRILTFKEQSGSLPTLVQEDINNGGAIYEFPIYSYTNDGFNLVLADVRTYWDTLELKDENIGITSSFNNIEGNNQKELNEDIDKKIASKPNLLINSNFDVWQRGTSFGSNGYFADRWYINGSFVAVERVTSNVGKYAARIIGNGGTVSINQLIENPNNVIDNKKTIVRANFNTTIVGQPCRFILRNETLGLDLETGTFNISPGNQEISYAFGSYITWNNDDEIRIIVQFDNLANGESVDIHFCDYRLGEVVKPFIPKTVAEELRDCQRYYAKSYNIDTVPGSLVNEGYYFMRTVSATTTNYLSIELPVPMRVPPTVTFYNASTGATGSWRGSGGVDYPVTAIDVGQNGFTSSFTTPAVNAIRGHYVADAEL